MKILSTKVLTNHQRDLLKEFDVKEVSMIDISFGENFKVEENIPYAVFTSANAVRSVFEKNKNKAESFQKVYCVGLKTKSLLESFGVQVENVADNALALADILVAKKIQDIHFYCGNLRNNDLPNVMAENGVLVTEYIVYKTELCKHTFNESFDAILFFSPSGVTSYVKGKNNCNVKVICIGYTTATEALDAFEEVYVAEETSVESVIQKLKEITKSS
ncbi:uroporphyrinogen-III synthase [Wenyingzhuangia sp. chi5]|uniref:Uroporphyrinogen-III synthase n=1 Tax=Wenyingzhuangia gilva TaxID=3057677 RepID=A0ABT8VTA2_9FLAO|nr:uroporphyrinogen-III synthase [Wenyingzhuangia sp. chi5]MDO3695184.1 uroporphyrinogen-III synthase [Wenyingzhuangia sp. chi5]